MTNCSRPAGYSKFQTEEQLTEDSKCCQLVPSSTTWGNLFVSERLVDDTSASVDSTMLQAAGPVWHKSDIKQNRLPIAGIDTDAKWVIPNQGAGDLDTNCT